MADKTTNLQLQKIDNTDYAGNFPTIYNNNLDLIDGLKSDLITSVAGKQDKLVAGSGITIGSDGKTISASGKEYTAGSGIQISSDGVISTKTPTEINEYSPIVLGSVDASGDISTASTTTATEITIVNFGTGKRTTNSYSIPTTNSLRKFSTKNKVLASNSYLYINPNDFPSFLQPVNGSAVNLSIIVLDGEFSSLISTNLTITSIQNYSIKIPSKTMLRNGNLTAYLINASW